MLLGTAFDYWHMFDSLFLDPFFDPAVRLMKNTHGLLDTGLFGAHLCLMRDER